MKSPPLFLGLSLKVTPREIHEVELEELDLKRRDDNTTRIPWPLIFDGTGFEAMALRTWP